ncbi:MAG: phosphate permease [Thermotogae bacterium]|uniref:inorganic phosphate transporter n=1 Tax=Kosmotoga sp. TaxID=1955248 RepID=UPI000F0E5790|nr:inorganic phosphate transporter [Kosmotoga sp.]MBO8166843.1 inorganic phosphate transporter [Kosmotoga sp.]MCD6159194.1 inorganic phosphate transporter [Kosmotoga sp.]RKX51212.1 MAG: phosphate permease [Thermotogota bacterium]
MILILSAALGLALAMAIGGNDVANSMATAVGAKAITVKQAVMIAAVLEFSGAFFFGAHVTSTITKGILNPSIISSDKTLMYGALSALIGAFIWLAIATLKGWPVSTTHSIVGGMVGFGIVAGGLGAVNWAKMLMIVSSWFISPFVGGLLAFVVFKLIAFSILRRKSPITATKHYAPLYIAGTLFIISFLFSIKTLKLGTYSSLLVGGVFFTLGFLVSFLLVAKYARKNQHEPYEIVEGTFRKMQVLTSCYVSFAHGANDVANAVGPLAVVYIALTAGGIGSHVEVPSWMLAIGGFGIALGVGIWGKKVMDTVGTRITTLNNTRGFSIDFAAATTVLLSSFFGMPVSTTHTVVGAVTGVGLAHGLEGVNRGVLKNILWAWFVTVPVSGIISGLLFMLFI